jgi:excinuclease UvrABC nuclease subunit
MGSGAREQAALLPSAPGVYRFRDAAGRILYLGRATSLRGRVASYWGDLGGRAHLYRMMARVTRVEAVACDSVHEAAWLERNLLRARLPPWNRAPSGGQESEMWIQLSDSARAPGLTVVYQQPGAARPGAPQVRLFGPYLGGRQVRLAVSGLCRVIPLQYADAELAGTRHEMARIAGVGAADRPRSRSPGRGSRTPMSAAGPTAPWSVRADPAGQRPGTKVSPGTGDTDDH